MDDRISAAKIAIGCLAPLLLIGCQEDRQILIRDLDGKQIEFSMQGPNGRQDGCIWSLSVFEAPVAERPVWSAGLDDNAECRNSVTAPVPPAGYSSEGSLSFDKSRSYVVQAYGPGFNAAKTFKPSELR